jgi:hypothetical protein
MLIVMGKAMAMNAANALNAIDRVVDLGLLVLCRDPLQLQEPSPTIEHQLDVARQPGSNLVGRQRQQVELSGDAAQAKSKRGKTGLRQRIRGLARVVSQMLEEGMVVVQGHQLEPRLFEPQGLYELRGA